MMLMDTTVLDSPIIYPTDVRLLYKAFEKMAGCGHRGPHRALVGRAHVKETLAGLQPAPRHHHAYLRNSPPSFVLAALKSALQRTSLTCLNSPLRQRWRHLIEVLTLLNEQTQQKLAGESHIDHRLVSLDDLDARPLKKGKSYPSTEFGTTLQMTFNRQGFMITTENFIGQPNEKTLYGPTLSAFESACGPIRAWPSPIQATVVPKTSSFTPKTSIMSSWAKAPMWMRPIKRRVARHARPPKASLPGPKI